MWLRSLLAWIFLALPVMASPIPQDSAQMLLVTSSDWRSTTATLQRYERKGGSWQPVGESWPVALGKGGLGWGEGLAPVAEGPRKQEGDGRAPAGVYRIGESYGYSPRPPAGTQVAYRPVSSQDRCVDDVKAPQYNQIVTVGPSQPVTWSSAEQMRRDDELYRWVIVVGHNSNPPIPGKGSCIFLHVWAGPTSPTAGCTAMAKNNLEQLLAWLRPESRPVLVQLPESSYRSLRPGWGLP